MTEYNSMALKDKRLISSLEQSYQYAKAVLANFIEKYFTDHSINHSDRVLKIVQMVLAENNQENLLSEKERYILTASVLLHDIGMQNEVEARDPRERRQLHHKLSADIILRDWKEMGLVEEFVQVIALVVEGHRGDLDERYKNITIGTGNIIRCDLLASLLFLCDELDISHERVDLRKRKYLNLNPEAALHFYKHYYTQGISIGGNRCIQIFFRYPSGRKEQYESIFTPLVVKKIEEVIKELIPTLQEKYKIFLALRREDILVEENVSIEAIEANLFEQIISESFGVKNYLFLNRIRFDEFHGDINPELFFKGNVRWADIVNDLDILRDQYKKIQSSLKEAYEVTISSQSLTGVLICGEGGSGKTTTLMRLAYDSLIEKSYEEANLLWLPVDTEFRFKELKNLLNATTKPIIVFVDGLNIDTVVESILNQLKTLDKSNLPIMLVFASRLNEWINAGGKKIIFNKFIEVQLNTLSESEMRQLLDKLEEHEQLYQLAQLSPEQRFESLKSKSNGQLLVAMLEATHGKHFYEIIFDEYKNIKELFPEAAKAYELISLFYIYDVLIPEELLITLVQCSDFIDFETRVLQHTHLIIVKHGISKYGTLYRPRHKEIAQVLIDSIPGYELGLARFQKVSIIIRMIDVFDRRQRYVILNFLNNYVTAIIKALPKLQYNERMNEVREFISTQEKRLIKFYEAATDGKHKPELIEWGKLFKELDLLRESIQMQERIVKIDPYDRIANYRLAKYLCRTRTKSDDPEKIANLFKSSYMGGNRRMIFLYDYLNFCLSVGLFNHLDSIISGFKDFISYSPEEEELREKLKALLTGYQIRRDNQDLVNKFAEIAAHVKATKDLKSEDEIEYIDKVESKDVRSLLNDYETHLATIAPSRPKGVLLRIAHLASKLSGEEKKALSYYKELFEQHIRNDPQPEHFAIIYEYVSFAAKQAHVPKAMVYGLFQLCRKLNPSKLQLYIEFSRYAQENDDTHLSIEIATEGLKAATMLDKYSSLEAGILKTIIEQSGQ